MQCLKILFVGLGILGLSVLPGCASTGLSEGRKLIVAGKTEAGLERLHAALAAEPGNIELRQYYHTLREQTSSEKLALAQREIDAGRFAAAEVRIRQVLVIHPENPRAQLMLSQLVSNIQHNKIVEEAEKLLREGKTQQAIEKARIVLAQTVSHQGAESVVRRAQASRASEEITSQALASQFQKPVTLEFRDAPLRSIFDMISRQSGINFVFDKDVRLDNRVSLFARNTPIGKTLESLMMTGGLQKKVVNTNTLLIYPNLPQKQKEHEELIIKGFYLGNADPKVTLTMLKSLLKVQDVFIDERLNLLMMRATPELVRLAEKLIALQDLPESEVMLEVEILEIKRSKLTELGIQYPNQFSLLFTPSSTNAGSGSTSIDPSAAQLTIQNLKNIASNQIAISPTPAVNLRKDNSDVNILANPRIRVNNRDKAKIHIGDKVPVITSNATSTGVISESVSYLDVGLKLDVEPTVMQRNDVQIKVALEVSNIVREVRNSGGTLTYQIGTRNTDTTLRLQNGETQVLAGLISEEDRTADSRIPGLGDLPGIGRLFSNQRDERNKTEIVLLITPRILRIVEMREPALTEFSSGTETNAGSLSAYGQAIPLETPAETSMPMPAPLPTEQNSEDSDNASDVERAQQAARATEAAEAQAAAAAAAAAATAVDPSTTLLLPGREIPPPPPQPSTAPPPVQNAPPASRPGGARPASPNR